MKAIRTRPYYVDAATTSAAYHGSTGALARIEDDVGVAISLAMFSTIFMTRIILLLCLTLQPYIGLVFLGRLG